MRGREIKVGDRVEFSDGVCEVVVIGPPRRGRLMDGRLAYYREALVRHPVFGLENRTVSTTDRFRVTREEEIEG